MQQRMTIKEFDILNTFVGITKSINVLLYDLYELEITGQKSSEIFEKKIEYLKMVLEVEQVKYKEISIDCCLALYSHLLEYLQYSMKNIDAIINDHIDLPVMRRIFGLISNKLSKDSHYFPIFISMHLGAVAPPSLPSNIGIRKKMADNLGKEMNAIIMMRFALFSQKIAEDNEKRYISELLKVKYDVASLEGNISFDLVNSNFDMDKFYLLISERNFYLSLEPGFDENKNRFSTSSFLNVCEDIMSISDGLLIVKEKAIEVALKLALAYSTVIYKAKRAHPRLGMTIISPSNDNFPNPFVFVNGAEPINFFHQSPIVFGKGYQMVCKLMHDIESEVSINKLAIKL